MIRAPGSSHDVFAVTVIYLGASNIKCLDTENRGKLLPKQTKTTSAGLY